MDPSLASGTHNFLMGIVQQACLDHVVMVHNWIDFSSYPLDTSPYNGHRLKVSYVCHRE